MILKKNKIYLNIYPTNSDCKVIFFRKKKNIIEILSEIKINIPMENRIFIEKNARNEYIKKIVSVIESEKLKYSECDSVFINIQENDVIVKNIKIDSNINKKDVIKAANIEIKEFSNEYLKKYCINYKRVYNEGVDTIVQVVLFPKKYIDLFSEVCDLIGIDERAMHTNFSLIERLIKREWKKLMNYKDELYKLKLEGFKKLKEIGVVEFRGKDLVISIFEKQNLKNSYVIRKNEFTEEMAESMFTDCIGVMVGGNDNFEDIKIVKKISNALNADFEDDLQFVKDYKRVSAEEYFNIAGKMLN